MYVFKTVNCGYDEDMMHERIRNYDVHSLDTRRAADFVLPLYRRAMTQKCVLYRGIKFWNDLPEHVKSIKSLVCFKNHILSLCNS